MEGPYHQVGSRCHDGVIDVSQNSIIMRPGQFRTLDEAISGVPVSGSSYFPISNTEEIRSHVQPHRIAVLPRHYDRDLAIEVGMDEVASQAFSPALEDSDSEDNESKRIIKAFKVGTLVIIGLGFAYMLYNSF